MTPMSEHTQTETATIPPVIVDLGKISRKKAKQLKKGRGPYVDEVLPAIGRVKAGLGKEDGGVTGPTVVVLYEKKRPKAKGLFRL